MTPAAPVPDLAAPIVGESYGGAYWDREEFTLRLAVKDEGTIHVTVETDLGHVVAEQVLAAEAAADVRDALRPAAAWPLPSGLTRELHWRLDGDERYNVDLHAELEQIHEWLCFATGQKTWDPADPEWSY